MICEAVKMKIYNLMSTEFNKVHLAKFSISFPNQPREVEETKHLVMNLSREYP